MSGLRVTRRITIPETELQEQFLRAGGPGGQHVNTSATAVQLRFDVHNSPSLPEAVRQRLIETAGHRITSQGEILIQAGNERSQRANRDAARERLADLIRRAAQPAKKRRPTGTPKNQKRKRLENKKKRGETKKARATPRMMGRE